MNQGPVVYLPKKGPNAYSKNKEKKGGAFKVFMDVFLLILVAVTTYLIFRLTSVKTENQEKNNPSVISDVENDETDTDTRPDDKRDEEFNSTLNSWVSFGMRDFREGVVVIDLERDKVIGEIYPDEQFNLASLYKVFVAYEGYKRVDNGSLDGNSESFDGKTVNECLALMIRESHSGCAENILEKIGEDELENIIHTEWGLGDISVSSLTGTPREMAKAMAYVYKHKGLSDASWKKLQDSLLNQPLLSDGDICDKATNKECNLRQGLPSGFSRGTKVYNKVGWKSNGSLWVTYNDAAILEFPKNNRHFVVAVMTEKFSTTEKIKELGDIIEEALIASFEYE